MKLFIKKLKNAVIISSLAVLAACGSGDDSSLEGSNATRLNGSGSSFVFPVMSQWATEYNQIKGLEVNYQSTGSGAGLRQINERIVDFAASDKPLSIDELNAQSLQQYPLVIGGIVMVVNLPGVEANQLLLSGEVIADIYMGNITEWNNPALVALNPNINLPDTAITPVGRSDGSGTTYNLADYLAKVSSEWQEEVGVETSLSWKAESMVTSRGNAGIANMVERFPGSIGYVEYAYALEGNLAYTKLINRAGQAVSPTEESFQSAASFANWQPQNGFELILTNQPGAYSWPITATVFVLFENDDKQNTKEVKSFLTWIYENGQPYASELDYVPLPDDLVQVIEAQW